MVCNVFFVEGVDEMWVVVFGDVVFVIVVEVVFDEVLVFCF